MKNKGADQTARMCRLVCACVVRKPLKSGFLASRPILEHLLSSNCSECLSGFPQALEIRENLENHYKSSMYGKILEFEKNLNNHGKFMEFCEII